MTDIKIQCFICGEFKEVDLISTKNLEKTPNLSLLGMLDLIPIIRYCNDNHQCIETVQKFQTDQEYYKYRTGREFIRNELETR